MGGEVAASNFFANKNIAGSVPSCKFFIHSPETFACENILLLGCGGGASANKASLILL